MKLSCNNKQCSSDITKKHNGVSTKMLQSQIVKTNGKHSISYNNSASDNINLIILSGDYDKNKKLLLCYKFNAYVNLFKPLSINKPELMIMLDKIISNLTLEEYNTVYGIKLPIVPEIKPIDIIIKKEYYVVTRAMNESSSYFIFKNYAGDEPFVPTYSYIFNLEDETNIGTELSFSLDKNDNEYKNIKRSDTKAGNKGAYILLTIPQDISYNKLYVYNRLETRIDTVFNIPSLYKYNLWGFTLSYINIQLDTVTIKRITRCPNTPMPKVETIIPKSFDMNINTTTTIKHLTQSSILTSIIYNGVHLYIHDIYDKTPVLYYTNFKFALNIGTYYLFVPPMYKLAFLNANQTSNFMYEGSNMSTHNVLGTDADGTYNFYSNTIKITIKNSFQPISIYTLNYGYLDAKNKIIFSNEAPLIDPTIVPRLINM
jgi:hypothetical protein